MRVTFQRITDHQRGSILIERDDNVTYRLDAGPITGAVPHDLVHYTVEDAMRMSDGIWGAIAGGIVYRSMTHVSGRRAPHAEQRSDELKRLHRLSIQRAELIGGLAEAAVDRPAGDLARMTREMFGSHPEQAPDVEVLAVAVTALRAAEERWRELAIGDELVLNWPGHRKLGLPSDRDQRERGRGRTRSRQASGT
jgi:hypothetical protein